jgi:branched-chain amino acid transport system permease protein
MDIATLKTPKNLITGAILLVILVLLATLPLYRPGYPVILLSSILMYVILTVGWVIFSGPTGYISLAPAAFFGFGIYTSAIIGKAIPFAVVVAIGGAASFCLALIVGALTLRLRGIYFAVFTFGLLMLIANSFNYYEIHFTGTRGRFVMVKGYDTIYLFMLGIFVLLMITATLIKHSKYGLALMSIGQEEEAAEGDHLCRQRLFYGCRRECYGDKMDLHRFRYCLLYVILFYAGVDGHIRRHGSALRPSNRRGNLYLP